LLALIVEARSGARFAHFLRRNIFGPLNMDQTLAYEEGLSTVPNRAYGYSADGAGFNRTDQNVTSSVLGDGGIYSSVSDLGKWDQALYAAKLVSRKLLRKVFAPSVRAGRPSLGYGFGWYVGRYRGMREIWHNGESIGFTTRIVRYPDRGLTVIILANRTDANITKIPRRIADVLFR
jgi:CubicO group peptidase (beta-lactamase class C family)